MLKQQEKSLYLFIIVAAVCVNAAGCGAPDGAMESAEEPEAAGQESTDEAASANSASRSCVTSGGGTWGAILEMCVTISADGSGAFTVTKQNDSAFSTAGTMYLKVGTHEPWGVNHASRTINGGGFLRAIEFSENFGQWPGYPKQYYARWESKPGGHAWVGPITIYR